MNVTEEIDRLWTLKGLDEQLVEARIALARFPEQKRALEARAADEKRKLEGLQTRIADAQKRRRDLEREVESATVNERKFQAQLPMVKKNDEYQALLHEIAAAKSRRSEIETQVLLQMDTEDGLGREKPLVERALKAAEAELNSRRSEIEAEERVVQERVSSIQAARAEQMAPLPAQMRSRYERAHQSLAGLAVVPILKNACGGCYRAQPPQVMQEARKRDRLIICEGCGRLLVWPPDGA